MKELSYKRLGERCYWETLPSGLTVYVLPRLGVSHTCALLAVRYGSQDERFAIGERWRQTPAGSAQLLQQLLLAQGQAALATQPEAKLSPLVRPDLNGYYLDSTKPIYPALHALLEACSALDTREKLLEQGRMRLALLREQRRRLPYPVLEEQLLGALYQEHSIRNSPLGTPESVRRITPEVMESCFKAFYRPSNMVLCVLGPVEPRKVIQLAATVINAPGRKRVRRSHGQPEPECALHHELEQQLPLAVPRFILGIKTEPEATLKARLVGELAAQALLSPASGLYAKLYREGLIGPNLRSDFAADGETAYFRFCGSSTNPAAVTEALLQEAVQISWNGLEQSLLFLLRSKCAGRRMLALDRFSDTCLQMAQGHFYGYRYLEFPQLYEQIQQGEVEELIRTTVSGAHSALSIVYPKGE